jgi:hypothetical protein
MPVSRTAFALSVSGPLVPVQDKPVGALTGAVLTATVVDWVAVPPLPVQVRV